MRRLPVNLASLPFEAVRRARRVVAAAAAIVVALTILHGAAALWLTEEPAAPAVAPVDVEQLRSWSREVDRLEAAGDVRRARATARSVDTGNDLIAWRTIPWSSIFADLEEALPDRVRLELVQPGIDAARNAHVSMRAVARDTGPLQDLLLALESHPRFAAVFPQREEETAEGLRRMTLQARYLRPRAIDEAAERTAGAGGDR